MSDKSSFRSLLEMSDKIAREELGDYYVMGASRMHNMLDCLESGAKQIQSLTEEVEHLRVQLAGCGVAAMCNTLESMEQQCVDRNAYGWSASYGDVLEAVKREIKYREALKAQLSLVDSNIITTWPDIAARLIAIAKEAVEI